MTRPGNLKSIRWRQESRSPNGSKVFRDEGLNAGGSVYHYLEYPHALSIFSEGRLRLANPVRWPDPYEQWWCQTLFGSPGPLHQTSAYVLCWSQARDDEPAWRMAGFQRTNPIVRIRCRIRDLLAAARTLTEQRTGTFFAGKVVYDREQALRKRASTVPPGDTRDISRTAAGLLLRKRKAFRFEKEVRTVWLDHDAQNTALYLPIDAKSVVRQVVCSPHAHPEQKVRIQQEFKDRFGIEVADVRVG